MADRRRSTCVGGVRPQTALISFVQWETKRFVLLFVLTELVERTCHVYIVQFECSMLDARAFEPQPQLNDWDEGTDSPPDTIAHLLLNNVVEWKFFGAAEKCGAIQWQLEFRCSATHKSSFFFLLFFDSIRYSRNHLTHEHAKSIRLATSSSPPPSSAQTKFHFITRVVRRALFTLQLSRSCNNVKGWLAPSQCISLCDDNNETKEGDQYHLRLHIYIAAFKWWSALHTMRQVPFIVSSYERRTNRLITTCYVLLVRNFWVPLSTSPLNRTKYRMEVFVRRSKRDGAQSSIGRRQ